MDSSIIDNHMDSSMNVNHQPSGMVDAMDVNGVQSPNDLSPGLNGAIICVNGDSGCCLFAGEESDDSCSDKLSVSGSKRKYGSESRSRSSSDEDCYESILKSRKLNIPLLVEPIRTVKFSELEAPVSPGSVRVENSTVLEAVPLWICPMENSDEDSKDNSPIRRCRQFWKAGDYEGNCNREPNWSSVGMDHVRVHPKFLHSNATSHKWALGAFAELLDNSLDEVCNGATYVHIDMLKNKRDGSRMLLIEDNGGGMCPDKMRRCMSLGYSSKRNMPNTIGQYGNGFKTSTMRLGADVLVFSRCKGSDKTGPTQSIGMLSYTFLMDTGKEDIVVPMVDFEFKENCWSQMMRSKVDWNGNLDTIAQWSPYSIEELLNQFNFIKDQGTRIIIYNLWEDDEGQLELDFDADSHDIQIRGANRDEKNIKMANQYPNSCHYLTYRHSLRTYASILYRRLPPGFRIILRGKNVEHHSIVNDLMLTKEIAYRPKLPANTFQKQSDACVTVTIGFVKDARAHIDVQGFSVYHKNRLIKPFWRIWNPAGSDGRGVIGVLEANFVEPAHDKQDFERTIVLSRLEARLVQIQKDYWGKNCQEVGYAARRRPVESNCNMDKLNSGPNTQNVIKFQSHTVVAAPVVRPTLNPNVNLEKAILPQLNVKLTTQQELTPQSTMYTSTQSTMYTSTQSTMFTSTQSTMYTSTYRQLPLLTSTRRVTTQPESTPQSTTYTSTYHQLPVLTSTRRVNQVFGQLRTFATPPPTIDSNLTLLSNNDISSLRKGREKLIDLLSLGRLQNSESLMAYFLNLMDKCKNLETKVSTLNKQLYEVTQKLEEKEEEHKLQVAFSSTEIIKKDQEIATLTERLRDAAATITQLQARIDQLESKEQA